MTQPFYEFEKPKRAIFTVAVAVDDIEKCECAVADCKTRDCYAEPDVYQCGCCGQWFCIEHISKDDLCDACAALPAGIREEIRAFREELR